MTVGTGELSLPPSARVYQSETRLFSYFEMSVLRLDKSCQGFFLMQEIERINNLFIDIVITFLNFPTNASPKLLSTRY